MYHLFDKNKIKKIANLLIEIHNRHPKEYEDEDKPKLLSSWSSKNISKINSIF